MRCNNPGMQVIDGCARLYFSCVQPDAYINIAFVSQRHMNANKVFHVLDIAML